MTRPLWWRCGKLGAALLASGLLFVGIAGLWHPDGPVRTATAAQECRPPANGDLLQATDDTLYLFTDGALRRVPDLETLRALGFDPNGADPIRDDCFRTLRIGEPFPSAHPSGQPSDGPGRAAAAATPEAPRDPGAPAISLDVSDAQPARRSTARLTARTDAGQGAGLLLAISRQTRDGAPGAASLVTTCAETLVCSVEVWEDEAQTWTFVATLYHCPTPGACIAIRESSAVTVTWR